MLDSGMDLLDPPLQTTTTPGERQDRRLRDRHPPLTPPTRPGSTCPPPQGGHGCSPSPAVTYTGPGHRRAVRRSASFRENARGAGRGSETGGQHRPRRDAGRDLRRAAGPTTRPGLRRLRPGQGLHRRDLDDRLPVNCDVGLRRRQPGHRGRESVPFVVQTDENRLRRQPRHRGRRARHARRRHHRGNKLFGGKMSGAAPGAKLMAIKSACLDPGLHRHAPDRRRALRRRTRRRRREHLHRWPPGAQRRQQRPCGALQPHDRRVQRPDLHLGGQRGRGREHRRRPVGRHGRRSASAPPSPSETWLSNYGSTTAQKQGLHGFSSRGPREDGGFKPNIVAPGAAISTTPRWQAGRPGAGHLRPARRATRCSTARRWPPRRRPVPPRCSSARSRPRTTASVRRAPSCATRSAQRAAT